MIADRFREEIESKGMISENQAGFKKGMGTMDQIYTLNYLINRQLGREKEKMAMFIDLSGVRLDG